MEINRYLIAALYVMAGCAVAIPLKVQGGTEPLNKERCRLVITNSVKVVVVYLEEETAKQTSGMLPPDFFYYEGIAIVEGNLFLDETIASKIGPLCLTSHRIRAPETFLI